MGTLVTPVLALIFARIQLGETPPSREALGFILILSGIGLLSAIAFLRNRRAEK
jgi:drug/metabolite transporter (DMT)-like permease